jgi:hypothetical protein
MTFGERDPLSVRYDGAAGRFVSRCLEAKGQWVETTVAPPTARIVGWAMARGIDPFRIRYTGRGSGVENAHEAAFRRACYYDIRIYLWSRSEYGAGGQQLRNPERVAALEFRWGRRIVTGRVARARVHSISHGSQHAAKNNPYDRV